MKKTSTLPPVLGKIVKELEYFQDYGIIWPKGYIAVRKFTSIKGWKSTFRIGSPGTERRYEVELLSPGTDIN
ncbi:hypothetical protein REPUB_Repub14bG0020100 [Reevesia pubescens]